MPEVLPSPEASPRVSSGCAHTGGAATPTLSGDVTKKGEAPPDLEPKRLPGLQSSKPTVYEGEKQHRRMTSKTGK